MVFPWCPRSLILNSKVPLMSFLPLNMAETSHHKSTGMGGGGGVDGAKSGRPLAEQSVTTQTLAIPHSFVPRLILMKPLAPQPFPQEFFTS